MIRDYIYFISITTDNTLNVLFRVSSIFSRYRINIEQLTVTETINKGISHFSITLHSNDIQIQKVIKKLDKIIEVIEVKIANKILITNVDKKSA